MLGVSLTASQQEIEQAYQRKLESLCCLLGMGKMQRLEEAYDQLKTEGGRDRALLEWARSLNEAALNDAKVPRKWPGGLC